MPLVGELSRKKGRFVFLLDAPEAEPHPIGSSGWEDARRKFFAPLVAVISAAIPPLPERSWSSGAGFGAGMRDLATN